MKLDTKPLNLEYRNKKLYLNNLELNFSCRKLKEMKSVLMDNKIINKSNENDILYLMFRDLKREEDREIFEKNKVRFDITIIFSKKLGKEFNKTFGHTHPIVENDLTYPEIYEILKGKALFVLQKFENEKVKEVLVIFGKKKDKILIPPNYGHVTINIGKRELILANLVSNTFSSIYEIYERRRGAAIYVLEKMENTSEFKFLDFSFLTKLQIRIVKNMNYKENFEIKFLTTKKFSKLKLKDNLYKSFIENPDYFKFLNKPSLFFK